MLGIAGVVFQVVGILTTGVGLWKTWHEFAQGEGFWEPFVMRAQRVIRWVERPTRRLLRRPQRVEGGGGLRGSAAGHAQVRARLTWVPLPTRADSALAALDRRTRELEDGLSDLTERHEDDLANIREEIAQVGDKLEGTKQQMETQTRHVAIGGLRYEVTGLFCVALGLLLQGLGLLVAAR